MAHSLDLKHLLNRPHDQRTEEWERAFFQAFIESNVNIVSEEAQIGPDGWPYLLVNTAVGAEEPVLKALDWLSTRGIGLAVNVDKEFPDYIFTYGMVWNYRERGTFITEIDANIESGSVVSEKGQQFFAGTPTEEYLPKYVRSIYRQFFKDQGVEEPKITMVTADKKHYDLCFSLESMGSPPEAEHQGIAEALAWFLPTHYSVMLASDADFPVFEDL